MIYQEADQLLQGRNHDRRRLANNTYLERRDGGRIAVRLHNTDIVVLSPGRVELRTGGWQTVTTKQRLNTFVPGHVRVWSDRGTWYIGRPGGSNGAQFGDANDTRKPWAEGITVLVPSGRIVKAGRADQPAREARYRRRVAKYADEFVRRLQAGKIPAPSGGDCWFCSLFRDQASGASSRLSADNHVRSHVAERYYVPSLLVNALDWRGSPAMRHNAAVAMRWGMPDGEPAPALFPGDFVWRDIRKTLRHYVLRQSGLAA